MAKICFGGALTHTAQMIRSRSSLTSSQDNALYGAIDHLGTELRESNPDLIVIFYGDHFNYFSPRNMPAICVGIGESYATLGEAGSPKLSLKGSLSVSADLTEWLLHEDFDVGYSNELILDHGVSCPAFLLGFGDIPILPIRINSISPPLVSPARAHALGAAVGRFFRETESIGRVAVLGTGGLSHFLPFPQPLSPQNDEEREMVGLMTSGSNTDRLVELIVKRVKDVSMSDAASATVNEEFDRKFLDDLSRGNLARILELTTAGIAETAGNGGQEIRTWIAASATVGDLGGTTLYYEPLTQWLTGTGVMRFNLS